MVNKRVGVIEDPETGEVEENDDFFDYDDDVFSNDNPPGFYNEQVEDVEHPCAICGSTTFLEAHDITGIERACMNCGDTQMKHFKRDEEFDFQDMHEEGEIDPTDPAGAFEPIPHFIEFDNDRGWHLE